MGGARSDGRSVYDEVVKSWAVVQKLKEYEPHV